MLCSGHCAGTGHDLGCAAVNLPRCFVRQENSFFIPENVWRRELSFVRMSGGSACGAGGRFPECAVNELREGDRDHDAIEGRCLESTMRTTEAPPCCDWKSTGEAGSQRRRTRSREIRCSAGLRRLALWEGEGKLQRFSASHTDFPSVPLAKSCASFFAKRIQAERFVAESRRARSLPWTTQVFANFFCQHWPPRCSPGLVVVRPPPSGQLRLSRTRRHLSLPCQLSTCHPFGREPLTRMRPLQARGRIRISVMELSQGR